MTENDVKNMADLYNSIESFSDHLKNSRECDALAHDLEQEYLQSDLSKQEVSWWICHELWPNTPLGESWLRVAPAVAIHQLMVFYEGYYYEGEHHGRGLPKVFLGTKSELPPIPRATQEQCEDWVRHCQEIDREFPQFATHPEILRDFRRACHEQGMEV